jgi:hypothetical protein
MDKARKNVPGSQTENVRPAKDELAMVKRREEEIRQGHAEHQKEGIQPRK